MPMGTLICHVEINWLVQLYTSLKIWMRRQLVINHGHALLEDVPASIHIPIPIFSAILTKLKTIWRSGCVYWLMAVRTELCRAMFINGQDIGVHSQFLFEYGSRCANLALYWAVGCFSPCSHEDQRSLPVLANHLFRHFRCCTSNLHILLESQASNVAIFVDF